MIAFFIYAGRRRSAIPNRERRRDLAAGDAQNSVNPITHRPRVFQPRHAIKRFATRASSHIASWRAIQQEHGVPQQEYQPVLSRQVSSDRQQAWNVKPRHIASMASVKFYGLFFRKLILFKCAIQPNEVRQAALPNAQLWRIATKRHTAVVLTRHTFCAPVDDQSEGGNRAFNKSPARSLRAFKEQIDLNLVER